MLLSKALFEALGFQNKAGFGRKLRHTFAAMLPVSHLIQSLLRFGRCSFTFSLNLVFDLQIQPWPIRFRTL